MPEARHLDRARIRVEQCAPAEAVADGPGADPDDVGGEPQVGVEGDDLGHLAAAEC